MSWRNVMLRKMFCCFGVMFFMASTPAMGQTQNDPALAQAKYEEAEKYYKLGEFGAALPLYRESYLLSGEPELLFNMGQCNRQLGRYEEAIKNYKAYLRDVPNSPTRPDVERLILEVEQKWAASTQSTSTSTSTSTKAPIKVEPPAREPMSLSYLWRENTLCKVGAVASGVGVGFGASALIFAIKERDNFISTSNPQKRANILARSSDLLLLSGVVLVGSGVFQERYKRSLGPHAALRVDPDGAQISFVWER
jgi:tetratricopeptide (TPR) repeat protein